MIVLQATQDIRKVSLWLGHANLATTEVYIERRGVELGMAEQHLDHADVDVLLEQVGGEAVSLIPNSELPA